MAMVTVGEIYHDGMIIQRGKPVEIRGNTDQAEHICITFLGQLIQFAADGSWSIAFPEIPFYGGPYIINIEGSRNRIIIKNIYVGEVWFAVGQSNMQFRLREEAGYEELMKRHCRHNIHMFRPNPQKMPIYDYDGFGWIRDMKAMVGKMSAVAYYFACNLAVKLQCPVGIIDCSMGSTSVACWMSKEAVSKCEPAQRVQKDEDNDYLPSELYQAMLEKVQCYKAAGVIYYQGESDIAYRYEYSRMLEMLIKDWREKCRDSIPFIEVLLPRFAYHGEAKGTEWAEIRKEQIAVAKKLKNVYLVNTINEGELSEIHPKRKRGIGNKLAKAALEAIYYNITHFMAPEVVSCEFLEDRAVLQFNNASVLREQDSLGESVFEVAGKEKQYFIAEYEIVGTKIILSNSKVCDIKYVRAGYQNYCTINVLNEYGVPLLPYMS